MNYNYPKPFQKQKHLPPLYVLAGKIKGRKIVCPPGEIRPMTARSRGALFDILGDLSGMEMLDLFCGSGSISIEAYSRGLSSSDLVELDPGKKEVIESNLKHAGFENAKLHVADVVRFCERARKQYDLIMIDPPYMWKMRNELIGIIAEKNLLKSDGRLIIQLPKKDPTESKIGDLVLYDRRDYGLNSLLFFHHEALEPVLENNPA